MVEDLLKLDCGLFALARLQIRQASQVNRVQKGYSWQRRSQVIRRCRLQGFKRSARIFLLQGNRGSYRRHPIIVH